ENGKEILSLYTDNSGYTKLVRGINSDFSFGSSLERYSYNHELIWTRELAGSFSNTGDAIKAVDDFKLVVGNDYYGTGFLVPEVFEYWGTSFNVSTRFQLISTADGELLSEFVYTEVYDYSDYNHSRDSSYEIELSILGEGVVFMDRYFFLVAEHKNIVNKTPYGDTNSTLTLISYNFETMQFNKLLLLNSSIQYSSFSHRTRLLQKEISEVQMELIAHAPYYHNDEYYIDEFDIELTDTSMSVYRTRSILFIEPLTIYLLDYQNRGFFEQQTIDGFYPLTLEAPDGSYIWEIHQSLNPSMYRNILDGDTLLIGGTKITETSSKPGIIHLQKGNRVVDFIELIPDPMFGYEQSIVKIFQISENKFGIVLTPLDGSDYHCIQILTIDKDTILKSFYMYPGIFSIISFVLISIPFLILLLREMKREKIIPTNEDYPLYNSTTNNH
ncbi:MAG: hypothetical protein ACXAD7_25070, partial [Candidatus Kariarchaeaceae archaeon]